MSKAQPGSGYGFTSSGYGFSLNTEKPFNEPAPSEYMPLNPSLTGNKISVSPGTVNRYIPTIGANYLDAIPAPTITAEGPGHICVKCTYVPEKYFPRSATIVFTTGATPPVDTNTESHYPIGRVNEITVEGVQTLVMLPLVQPSNLVVNRLKAGANIATWWWEAIN